MKKIIILLLITVLKNLVLAQHNVHQNPFDLFIKKTEEDIPSFIRAINQNCDILVYRILNLHDLSIASDSNLDPSLTSSILCLKYSMPEQFSDQDVIPNVEVKGKSLLIKKAQNLFLQSIQAEIFFWHQANNDELKYFDHVFIKHNINDEKKSVKQIFFCKSLKADPFFTV